MRVRLLSVQVMLHLGTSRCAPSAVIAIREGHSVVLDALSAQLLFRPSLFAKLSHRAIAQSAPAVTWTIQSANERSEDAGANTGWMTKWIFSFRSSGL